ncbi:MAG: FtsX-like permease family protein [Rhizobiales bacterium]|nr:FtsX-like permease family protein [Hyphomicrobiales bacterium]
MNLALFFRFAWRDLRSGLQGFWIFLTCLALGTAAIAMIGSLSAAIERGIEEQGQPLLGGDIEFSLVHRQASPDELAFIAGKGEVSRIATLRAMAVAGDATTLIEAKAVDDRYPLYGSLEIAGGGDLKAALSQQDGFHGAVVDELLLGRLGIKPGDRIKIGTSEVVLRGLIANEPDRISDGIVLGPRIILSDAALQETGLIQPGSLITWRYRLKLGNDASLDDVRAVVTAAEKAFPDAGWRLRTRDRAAAGAENFVERLGYFMTLVGLTALIVGGAGIANAVSAFVNRRTSTIATLKCLGAPSRTVFGIYLTEILILAVLAIAIGVLAGALVPPLAQSFLRDILPLPISNRIEPLPLLTAAAYGFLVTIAFAVWPLARTRRVPASALFRHRIAHVSGWPALADLIAIAAALGLIALLVFLNFDDRRVTLSYLAGLAGSFVILLGLANAIVRVAAVMPKPKSAILRYAVSNLYRPGAAAQSVILALGLGLTLFVTLALTDRTIGTELQAGLPERAPAFFFLDVRNDELPAFVDKVKAEPGVTHIETAPMLRGRIARLNDTEAGEVKASPDAAWALRGDRGLTYADTLPEGSKLIEGEWWPKDYDGPPLVSFVGEVAEGLGLKIGDTITVNVLGRDITAKIANFRSVNWRTLGINFLMVFTPSTLKAAPHHFLVTVEMEGGDEARLLNQVARAFPSVTAVRVKDAIDTVSDLLGKMLAAIRGANILTLITGVLVLAGALAAGLSGRIYDAVVLKTYGATRRQLIQAFIAEYAVLGIAAAIFGIAVGSLAAWFLAYWILEMPWQFSPATAILTALVAMAITIAAGLAATWRALTAKPAPMLRNE